MTIDRRQVLKGRRRVAARRRVARASHRRKDFAPKPGTWRSFQIVTRLEIAKPQGKAQAWIPLPSVNEAEWFSPTGSTWTTNAKTAAARSADPKYGARDAARGVDDGEDSAVVEVTSKFTTRDRAIDLSQARQGAALSAPTASSTPARPR